MEKQEDEIFCPGCAKPIKKDFAICPYCRSEIDSKIIKDPNTILKEDEKQCPICKLNIPKQAQVCPLCKADLNIGNNLFRVIGTIIGVIIFIIVAIIFFKSCSFVELFK